MTIRPRVPTVLAVGIAVAAAAAPWHECRATLVTLQSGVSPSGTYQTQDAHVRNDNLTQTDNNTRILVASLSGANAGKSLRGLFSYPLTDIPAGATINSVTFRVMQVDGEFTSTGGGGANNNTGGDVTVEMHSISQSFSQGTGVAGIGGANWNNTFGGSMTLGPVLSSATMNAIPPSLPTQSNSASWVTTDFNSTLSLVGAVQAQLNAGQPFNFALTLTAADEVSGLRRLIRMPSNTEVTTGLANRPALIIDYSIAAVPEASSFLLFSAVAAGIGVVMNSRRGANSSPGASSEAASIRATSSERAVSKR
ncbi:MAG: hypothetical protein KF847_19620 [Pirellulales bacterium]|nr:hypothetical protein [Pirellulales bacterium]